MLLYRIDKPQNLPSPGWQLYNGRPWKSYSWT